MKIHYLNCGTMYPRGAKLFVPQLKRVPCHCLLIETGEQLVLVDTGIGTGDMEDPNRLGHSNLLLNAVQDLEQTAVRGVERLGFRPEDVGHVICTHLDRDHAGGLPDFPHARVHVLRAEYEAASRPQSRGERERYRKCHFAHGPMWVTHETISTEAWFGMDCIRGLPGLPPSILLVPLPGHTRGHCGVAVETGNDWLLHCGDAYYIKDELDEGKRPPPGVRLFRRIAHVDPSRAQLQIARLSMVTKENREINLIASHDPEAVTNV